MRVICTATIPDDDKRKTLCTCIKIIGGMPKVNGNVVCVEYIGNASIVEKYIDLFERYDDYHIKLLFHDEYSHQNPT